AVLPMAKQPHARASAAWATAAAAAAATTIRRNMGSSSAGADAFAEVALRVGAARRDGDGGARELGVAGAEEAQRELDGDVDDREADRRRAHEHGDGRRRGPPAVIPWARVAEVDVAAIDEHDGAVGGAMRGALERDR